MEVLVVAGVEVTLTLELQQLFRYSLSHSFALSLELNIDAIQKSFFVVLLLISQPVSLFHAPDDERSRFFLFICFFTLVSIGSQASDKDQLRLYV
jgi:hypothetical protein